MGIGSTYSSIDRSGLVTRNSSLPAAEFERLYGIRCAKTIEMGSTRRSQAEFHAFIRELGRGEFVANKYKLLSCNCNTFSDRAVRHGIEIKAGIAQDRV